MNERQLSDVYKNQELITEIITESKNEVVIDGTEIKGVIDNSIEIERYGDYTIVTMSIISREFKSIP